MRLVAACMLVVGLVGTSCSAAGKEEVLVSAASSLTVPFVAIEQAYEERNPGVDVVLNFAGSSALREQLLAGAPGDVFASANESVMQTVVGAGLVRGNPTGFTSNRLAIAIPSDNPGEIAVFNDLSKSDLLIGICAEGVPCGDFARAVLARADLEIEVASNEPNVRSLLAKVEAGELDAGIVYYSDVLSGYVNAVAVSEEFNMLVAYPIARLVNGGNPEAADSFVEFVLSLAGQQILAESGFGA